MKKSLLIFMGILLGAIGSINAQFDYLSNPMYGRIWDITYDLNVPNKMYAITAQNHLVVSTDNGVNWEPLYTNPAPSSQLKNLKTYGDNALSFMVKNDSDPSRNTVFIYNTISNSISHQITPPVTIGAELQWIDDYTIDENNSDIIGFVQGYRIGFSSYTKAFYTINGGANWSQIYHSADSNDISVHIIAFSPDNSSKILLLRGGGPNGVSGGVLMSEDAGSTWTTQLTGTTFASIGFNPDNSDDIYIGSGIGYRMTQNLFHSTDGGITWAIVPINWDNYYFERINYIGFDPSNSDKIIVLEVNEIVISTDAGATWTNYVYDGYTSDLYMYGEKASFNPSDVSEIVIGTDFHPVRSNDGGVSLSSMENRLVASNFVGLSPDENHMYSGVQYGVDHKDISTGVFTPFEIIPIDMAGNFTTNTFIDANKQGRFVYAYVSWNGTNIKIVDDHGATVTASFNNLNTLVNVQSDPNNTDKLWFAWDDGSTEIILASDPTNITNVPLSGWTRNTKLLFDSKDPLHVIAGKGGTLQESFDYGLTWAELGNGLTLDPDFDVIDDIQRSPFHENEMMIATTQGIYRSIDNGENWNQVVSSYNTARIEYSHLDSNIVAAAVYSYVGSDFHLYISKTGGEEWKEIPSADLMHIYSQSADFTFTSDSIFTYIATMDLGVVKYAFDLNEFILSTPELPLDSRISVYPNPVNSILNITVNNDQSIQSVQIYSMTGSLVKEYALSTGALDVSDLQNGSYFIKITDTVGNTYHKSFMKQ